MSLLLEATYISLLFHEYKRSEWKDATENYFHFYFIRFNFVFIQDQ